MPGVLGICFGPGTGLRLGACDLGLVPSSGRVARIGDMATLPPAAPADLAGRIGETETVRLLRSPLGVALLLTPGLAGGGGDGRGGVCAPPSLALLETLGSESTSFKSSCGDTGDTCICSGLNAAVAAVAAAVAAAAAAVAAAAARWLSWLPVEESVDGSFAESLPVLPVALSCCDAWVWAARCAIKVRRSGTRGSGVPGVSGALSSPLGVGEEAVGQGMPPAPATVTLDDIAEPWVDEDPLACGRRTANSARPSRVSRACKTFWLCSSSRVTSPACARS